MLGWAGMLFTGTLASLMVPVGWFWKLLTRRPTYLFEWHLPFGDCKGNPLSPKFPLKIPRSPCHMHRLCFHRDCGPSVVLIKKMILPLQRPICFLLFPSTLREAQFNNQHLLATVTTTGVLGAQLSQPANTTVYRGHHYSSLLEETGCFQ